MARQQLTVMVRNLRAECGHSLSTVQGTNQVDTLKYLLARTQEELWVAFTWPDLTIRADIQTAAGQYIYPYPANLAFDQIRESFVAGQSSADWTPIGYGIGETYISPLGDNTERSDPVQAWDVESDTTFRVWPTPNTGNSWLRFKGNKPLSAFAADADMSTLDATLIILFTASDLLARAKAEDAPSKLQKAQRHLTKLLGNKISAKNKVSTLGGGSPAYRTGINRHLVQQP